MQGDGKLGRWAGEVEGAGAGGGLGRNNLNAVNCETTTSESERKATSDSIPPTNQTII